MGIFKALSLFALTELTSSYITRMALRSKYSTLCTLFTALLVRLNEMKPYLVYFRQPYKNLRIYQKPPVKNMWNVASKIKLMWFLMQKNTLHFLHTKFIKFCCAQNSTKVVFGTQNSILKVIC